MRFLSFLLHLAAALLAFGTVVFHVIASAISCHYSGDPDTCGLIKPWEMSAEEFVLGLLLPLGGAALLLYLGRIAEPPPPQ
jgi:hypothetical protein